jgi:hypothetical protein
LRNMKLSEIDYGEVVYINSDLILDAPLEDQTWSLNGDLIFVKYEKNIILDIGWSNEFGLPGEFVVHVISNSDWSKPLAIERAGVKNILDAIKHLRLRYGL